MCPQSSGHSADVVRFSLGWGWRSPRSGTIDRFFCAYKPLEPWVSKLQRVPACVARCSAIAKPVAFLLGMWRYCKTNTARNGCWCVKPGPQRITTATPSRRALLDRSRLAFDPSRELHRVPARSGSQLQSRPGVRCSIGPGSHSIHRGNRVESRPRGLQLQPRPRVRCSIDPGSHRSIEETASSPGPVDHNCNASRRVSLDESPQRSNVIESCIDSRLLENRGLRFLGGGFSNQKLLCDCGKGF